MTREQWLLDVTKQIEEKIFNPLETVVPKLIVSVGFPKGNRHNPNNKAETIDAELSADNESYHVFISPTVLDKSTLVETLFGEMVLATLGKRPPKVLKTALSLTKSGKRWYPEVGSETAMRLNDISATLPAYPHIAVTVPDQKEKQTTRMKKIVCLPNDKHANTVLLRGAATQFQPGFPTCYCGNKFQYEQNEDYEVPAS